MVVGEGEPDYWAAAGMSGMHVNMVNEQQTESEIENTFSNF